MNIFFLNNFFFQNDTCRHVFVNTRVKLLYLQNTPPITLTGYVVIDRQAFEVSGNFFEGVWKKSKISIKIDFFQKSFMTHFEALLISFPIIETIF
jgi:hypothetical protein